MQTITPKRIPYIRKPFIRPTNWLFRLITWITVSKTGSFLSKSCRVCEKCQLKQSTGTGNVFTDILTADPNTLAYTQAARITSGTHFFANERSTLLLHTSMTPCPLWGYLVPFDIFEPKVHTVLISFLIYYIQPPSQFLSLTVELKRNFLITCAVIFTPNVIH